MVQASSVDSLRVRLTGSATEVEMIRQTP